MKIKLNVEKSSLVSPFLLLCFVFLGFRVLLPGLLLTVVCILMLLLIFRFEVRVHVAALAIAGFYLMYALFGIHNYEAGALALLRHSIIFMLPSLLMVYLGSINRRRDVVVYALVNLTYSYVIVLYSYLNGYFGYGELYNVFVGGVVNSPGYVILILVSTFVCCDKLLGMSGRFGLFIAIGLLLAAFLSCAIYMQSRFSLVSLAIYLLYVLVKNVKVVLIVGAGLILFFVFVGQVDLGGEFLSRWSSSGFNSARWTMWEYGLHEMFNKPFGGMRAVDSGSASQGIWFHNVYLDLARISGLLLVFLWIVVQMSFTLFAYFNLNKDDFKFYIAFFLFLSMAVFQDLAFEGYYNYMLYFFYVFGLAVSSGSGKVTVSR